VWYEPRDFVGYPRIWRSGSIAKDGAELKDRRASDKIGEAWEHASVSAVGIEMGLAAVIGLLLGLWLDRRFDTDPLFMLLFLGFGLAAGFKGLIRVVRQEQRKHRDEADSDSQGDAGAPPASDET
jgi:ATP synthase protein I